MSIFRSFRSTASPFLSRQWPANLKLLVDPVTGAPTGIESPNANGPDGIWTPVDLTAAQIASPTALMIADLNATYRLNVAPYTRYQSDGTTLQAVTAGGVFLPLAGGTVTGNVAVTGSTLLGSGTPTGNPYQFQSVKNADPSTLGADSRFNVFQDILTYSVDTNNTWEGLVKLTFINGPGASNGEINGIHSYVEYESDAKAAAVENYEASTLNKGQVTGIHAQYLGSFHNGLTGTAANVRGLRIGLVNDNTTPDVIGDWAAIENSPKSGLGSMPTAYRFIKNADTQAVINTMAGVIIGSLTIPGTGVLLDIHGTDSLSTTAVLQVHNAANQSAFIVNNDMSIVFANNLAKIAANGEITAPLVDYGSTTGLVLAKSASKLALYGGTPILKQTGVPVTAAGIHAALVALNVFAA